MIEHTIDARLEDHLVKAWAHVVDGVLAKVRVDVFLGAQEERRDLGVLVVQSPLLRAQRQKRHARDGAEQRETRVVEQHIRDLGRSSGEDHDTDRDDEH